MIFFLDADDEGDTLGELVEVNDVSGSSGASTSFRTGMSHRSDHAGTGS